MLTLAWIVEQRIREAIERGDFAQLPGAGRPLLLDDDPLIPEDLRVAYRILKNAGYAPPEVQCLRQIGELERWLERAPDGESRRKALARLSLLRASLGSHSGAGRALDDPRYVERLLLQFDRKMPGDPSDHRERS